MLPSQQMANGQAQQNGTLRNANPVEIPAILHLLPMNGTFERKTINVPFYPDILRIGRQTNAKTAPTPTNGFFDSKVLSRQHAEVYAERNGRVYIRDVKSSNGTFVNGQRLSPENKESEPHELREQDVLELGIDIVSEDQKSVVHHKVAARVEHVGVYAQADVNFGETDPNAQNGYISTPMMKRAGSQSSIQSQKANVMAQMAANQNVAMQQPAWSFPRFTPRTVEDVVKKLNVSDALNATGFQLTFVSAKSTSPSSSLKTLLAANSVSTICLVPNLTINQTKTTSLRNLSGCHPLSDQSRI